MSSHLDSFVAHLGKGGERQRARSFVEVINQASEVVMTFKVVDIIAKRSPGRCRDPCPLSG